MTTYSKIVVTRKGGVPAGLRKKHFFYLEREWRASLRKNDFFLFGRGWGGVRVWLRKNVKGFVNPLWLFGNQWTKLYLKKMFGFWFFFLHFFTTFKIPSKSLPERFFLPYQFVDIFAPNMLKKLKKFSRNRFFSETKCSMKIPETP